MARYIWHNWEEPDPDFSEPTDTEIAFGIALAICIVLFLSTRGGR